VLQHRSTSVPAEPRSISDRPTGFAVRLVIGSLALCVLTGCSQVTRDAVDRQVDHGMTSDEVMTARRVALARALREHVSVKARVTAGEGTVPASAAIHHKACESGPLLTITLRGNFPQSPSRSTTPALVSEARYSSWMRNQEPYAATPSMQGSLRQTRMPSRSFRTSFRPTRPTAHRHERSSQRHVSAIHSQAVSASAHRLRVAPRHHEARRTVD
jgi:hypothetical protein